MLNQDNLYRLMLDGSSDPIFTFDSDYRYMYANQAFAEGIGKDLKDVIGKTLWDVFSEEEAAKRMALVKWVFDNKKSKTHEIWVSRGSADHYYLTTLRPIVDDHGQLIAVAANSKDITDRKLAEARLLSAKADAELANRAKSRFLAAASHDLRQPLAALSLYVDVLKGRSTVQDSPLVSKIEACCASLSVLLTDLLDVSKLDAGVVGVNVDDFAIDDLLNSLVKIHSAEANAKGLHLRLRPSPGVIVRTDYTLLTRIVGNLLSNAIRFTHEGGVLVACRSRAGGASLEVWDTGVGIEQEKTGLVFQEFYKLDEARSASGSGLGLSIVSKAADLLGLPIRLRSKIGQGSMFAIDVPRGCAGSLKEAIPSTPHLRSLRIGLVEDNAQVMDAMALTLESAGYEVVAAATGKSLLTALDQRKPDIVISDYRLLAGETGFQVVQSVRAAFDNTLPAIITTGDTNPNLIREMARHGIDIHYKPLQMEKLLSAVNEATKRSTL